jgi:superfamily II DNA/RNA helicase
MRSLLSVCCAVLCESDRLSRVLQGFVATLNAIVENLPRKRQTMLFSATQTKSVSHRQRAASRRPLESALCAPPPLRCLIAAAVHSEAGLTQSIFAYFW